METKKRDLPVPEVKGYNTPQIRIKRSGQFGSNGTSYLDTNTVPSYATLPRNTRNSNHRRSKSLNPHTHFQTRGLGSNETATPGIVQSKTLPRQPRPAVSPTRQQPRSVASPGLHRSSPGLHRSTPLLADDSDKPVSVSITTTPCMKINRISQEEQIAKAEARRRKKQEYFQTTPASKIQVTQRNLEAYVQFYEKKLSSIVADMDSNIAKEKRKKEKLEGKLKKLLDANALLSKELAGIRKDLKKCHILTETPV